MNKHPIILEAYRIINEVVESTTYAEIPTELDEDTLFEAIKLLKVELHGKRHTVWDIPAVKVEDLNTAVLCSPRMSYYFGEPRFVHIVSIT